MSKYEIRNQCKYGCTSHKIGEFYLHSGRTYRWILGRNGALNALRACRNAYPNSIYAIFKNGRKTRW